MSETLVGVLQGITTGVGILAAGVGLFLAASTTGNFQFVVNDQVVAWHAPSQAITVRAARGAEPVVPAPELPTSELPAGEQRDPLVASEPTVTDSTPAAPYTADATYYNDTASGLALLVVSLKRLDILLAAPQIEDEGWRTEMTILISGVRMGADNLAHVQPSESSIDLHSFLMVATTRCARVALSLDGDLARLPVETFQLAGDTLASCTSDILSVLQSIN